MGRARSNSTDNDEIGSMDPHDGTASGPSLRSGKKSLLGRFKKFGGGGSEWQNGCGAVEAAEKSDEFMDVQFGPPVLTIQVDNSKDIDLSARVRQKSDEQISQEFALAAREAVKQQMIALRQEEGECSSADCNTSTAAAADGQSVVSSLGNTASVDISIGTGSANFDKSTRSLPPPIFNPTSLLDSFGLAKIQEIIISKTAEPALGDKVQARNLVFRHSGTNGCLVFVIRRPGCLLCREQALYLKFLFQNYPKEVEGFTIVGVVKEFCEKGGEKLREFHDKYFPFPLYLDVDRAAYKALGNRKAGLGAALKVLNPFSDASKRIKKNQISGDMTGEGFLQGGIIIYHRHGMAAYKYEEETGLELPVADIVKGLRSVRRDDFVAPLPPPSSTADSVNVKGGKKKNKESSSSHRRNKQFDVSIRTVG